MWWFEHPTIKTLSGYLREQTRENPGQETIEKAKAKEKKMEEKQVQAVKTGINRLEQLKRRATKTGSSGPLDR